MIDLIRSAAKNVLRRRRQLFLTVAGIGIGVFSVLLISAIGSTGGRLISDELESLGFSCVTISANDRKSNLLREASVSFLREQAEISAASPLFMESCQVTMRGHIGDAMLCGIDSDADQIITFQMDAGRFLSPEDIRSNAPVCLVNEKLAVAFYGRSNITGKTISVTAGKQTQAYTIIGVVAEGEGALSSFAGSYLPYMVYIPYSTFGVQTGRIALDMVFLRFSDNVENIEQTASAVTDALSVSDGYRNLYKYQNLATQKESVGAIVEIVTLVLTSIGAVSLLVSGLSIMTIMIASVTERTREIGVKKALGAGQRIILLEFLTEAILITAAGSALGIALSWLLCAGIEKIFALSVVQNADVALRILMLSTASGIIFGVYPAVKAARLSPLDALRRE